MNGYSSTDSSVKGLPQLGQLFADSLIFFPHSGHLISAILKITFALKSNVEFSGNAHLGSFVQ